MRRLIKYILITITFLICGCGNSFYEAQDYFTGPVSGVGLKKSTTISSGSTEQLNAVVVPSKTANKNVTWTSSDPAIASVDANGLVTGVINVAHGDSYQATITVTTEEGGFTAQCLVTIVEKPVHVTGVTLNKSSGSLYYASSSDYSTDQLTAAITPSTATNQNITWSSDDSTIASVNSSGLVTPNRTGTTKIRVTSVDGGYSATCTYTIAAAEVPVASVTLNTSATTIVAGQSETLFAYITPVNATNQTVSWTSSNTGAATVDPLGNVTGVAAGTAMITATATDGTGKYAQATVTVVATAVPVTGVTLSKTSATVTVGDSLTLTATISPAGATNRNIQWNSTNTGVASVSSSGVVTGIAAGSATVKVTTVDGGFTASCIVTVTNEVTYKIIYNGNGATDGSVPVDSSGYLQGSPVIIMTNGTLVNSGYSFSTWNTVSNGSGFPYSPGSTLTMGSSDITLYAQWNLSAPSGLSYSTPSATYLVGQLITNNVPSITGTVTSWSINPALPTGLTFNTATGVISGTPAVTQDPTLYTVTASNAGGSITKSILITVSITVPDAPTVTPGLANLSLTWTAIPGAIAYEVWYNTTNTTTGAIQQGGDISGTSYTITGLTSETLYYVWLRVKIASDISGFSTVAIGIAARYNIGDTGPGGGIIFYFKNSYSSDGNGFWRYLEAAPTDQGSGGWSNVTNILIGTTSYAIGTGKTNTVAIMNQTGASSGAAFTCHNYSGGSYTDWFLPSLDELNMMYINLKAHGIGGFNNVFYWSSSETGDPSYSMVQFFSNGAQPSLCKACTGYVRPIRAF